jgi:hypothetical protein
MSYAPHTIAELKRGCCAQCTHLHTWAPQMEVANSVVWCYMLAGGDRKKSEPPASRAPRGHALRQPSLGVAQLLSHAGRAPPSGCIVNCDAVAGGSVDCGWPLTKADGRCHCQSAAACAVTRVPQHGEEQQRQRNTTPGMTAFDVLHHLLFVDVFTCLMFAVPCAFALVLGMLVLTERVESH